MRVNAVIVAAGDGKRMGSKVPKIFLPIAGRPIILHTLDRFMTTKKVRKVILVAAEKTVARCRELIRSDRWLSHLECVVQAGGARRQDSVAQGLKRIDEDCEVVVVHDGVRPFISPRLIDRCVDLALKEGAVVVGIPVRDTIKVLSVGRRVHKTPPRDSLWQIQTPQAFRTEIIRQAYDKGERDGIEATDDAMLVEHLGRRVLVLEGQPTNIKITVPEDLLFAEALLRARKAP